MSTATQHLHGLLDDILGWLNEPLCMPTSTLYRIADRIVTWSKGIDLESMGSHHCQMLGKLVEIVSTGLSGDLPSKQYALRSMSATASLFSHSLKKELKRAA